MRVELPPEPAHFVNRDEERAQALRAVAEWQGRARPLIVSLSGPAGLGKTELAFLLARTLKARYPDGVLSVDLDDFRVEGVFDPAHVLAQLLESLGVDPDMLARSYKALCKQYWNRTAAAGLIVVVDNARYASEVVPLLPASGDSLVLVASQGPLDDLGDGASVPLSLLPLEELDSRELLDRIAGDRRLAKDPEAVRALVRLCEGLPAALQVAGRWVHRHPLRSLPRLITDLRTEWDEKGVSGVERIWDTAYAGLGAEAAALYRLLPYHPGPAFTRESAAALLGLGAETCEEALDELYGAGLLDLRFVPDGGDGRMRLLGPLHAHARRRARRDATEAEVTEAQTRVLRWLARQSQLADRFAAGRRLVVADPLAPVPGAPDAPLADPATAESDEVRAERAEQAARWLHEQRHVLFAGVRLAHRRGLDAEVVALCEAVWTHALDHPRQSDVVEAFRLGVASAVRSGNARWLVRMRCQLARPLWESGELAEAGRELDAATAALDLLGDSADDRKLVASAIEFRGMLKSAHGDWSAAKADFAHSREVHRGIRNDYGVLLQSYRMGEAAAELGDLAEARDLLTEAHTLAKAQHRERITGRTGFALGGVLRRLGRTDEAQRLYELALDGARRRRSTFDQARILDALTELAEQTGHLAEAEENRAAAADIRRRNGLL